MNLEEQLYCGSVPVTFSDTKGAFQTLEGCNLEFVLPDEESLKEIRLRIKPLEHLGKDYANLIVAAIPATDIRIQKKQDPPISGLLEHISTPLVKSDKNINTKINGVQSGRRSAILFFPNETSNVWIRIKGCGDLYYGFPIQEVADHPELVEIRGCLFDHTASRELAMTQLINNILIKNNLAVANVPIGWWNYDIPCNSNMFPKIKKCCCIYETYGDKRLSDHILVGIEKLIPFLLPASNISSLSKEWINNFPANRRMEDPMEVSETWIATLGHEGQNPLDLYADFYNVHIPEKAPSISEDLFVDPKWNALWNESCKILSQAFASLSNSNSQPRSLLAYVFYHLGKQVGDILGAFHKNDISWGTYNDLLGTHCNAHPNNLILRKKSNFGIPWIAALDFDMAFTKSTFDPLDTVTNKINPDLFNQWIGTEERAMRMNLAGDQQLNSGVKGEAVLSNELMPLKWALRDTMVVGFNHGYSASKSSSSKEAKEGVHLQVPELHDAVYALFNLALIVTEKDIA